MDGFKEVKSRIRSTRKCRHGLHMERIVDDNSFNKCYSGKVRGVGKFTCVGRVSEGKREKSTP